jgi:hypothetical protein
LSEYNSGFNHPKLGFPARIRASFTSATIAATTGALALVPSTWLISPAMTI